MMRRILLLAFVALAAFGVTAVVATASGGGDGKGHGDGNAASKVKHIVVIYEENHSFDNLYGSWEGVNGRARRERVQDDPDQPGGRPLHLPASERRELHGAAAVVAAL